MGSDVNGKEAEKIDRVLAGGEVPTRSRLHSSHQCLEQHEIAWRFQAPQVVQGESIPRTYMRGNV